MNSRDKTTSTPSVFEFNPNYIPWQADLCQLVLEDFDYAKYGTLEVLLSGSVGSAKSLPAAYLGVRHCLENAGATLLIGRRSLPELKDTIFLMIKELLDCGELIEKRDYTINETSAKIFFRNGSKIISRSWADRKYKKLGSLPLSAAIIEELAENDDKDEGAYQFIKMRVGRLPHIEKSWLISCTNPDSPSHFAHRRLIESKEPNIKVFYSLLSDNPFLSDTYKQGLLRDMDPKLAERMIYGKWVDIQGETIYSQYNIDRNYRDFSYKVNIKYPIRVSWDFNIGEGKPMSVVVFQIVGGILHCYQQAVIEGMRTEDSLYELQSRGIFDFNTDYIINGDANGRSRDTRNKFSDYDIIEKWLANYKNKWGALRFELDIPSANPPVRQRHNNMNAYLYNALKQVRFYIYKDCPMLEQGLRLTKLKKGGNYIEDDSKAYQHITTSIGYGLESYIINKDSAGPSMYRR